METAVVIGFAGGYAAARIMLNHNTGQWDVDFLAHDPETEDGSLKNDTSKGKRSFNNPVDALHWVAETQLNWDCGLPKPEPA